MMGKAAQCPICEYRRSQIGKINEHILAKKDAAHASYADRLTRCRVCQKKFKSPQGRSQHEHFFPCTRNTVIPLTSSGQHAQHLDGNSASPSHPNLSSYKLLPTNVTSLAAPP